MRTSQVRRVLDTIRGRSYEDALILMEYMPYRACEKIIKALISVRAVGLG
jgi:large subunit ribosomal protein L22